ncbi:TIGR01777 family oxidoreductase [Bacillus infantis]|uniref:TIGR01777 family protein n=1 Tax=Bacillus infantis TaxID=324767 RepID=A0A5D4RG37_9BACI|nr:TIGR01777 family oxidoreductase [Bacillus infantis]TYS48422.1 TIGR01777 family protein [Bacillus infantis]
MRIAVTGGTGFVGHALVKKLAESGHTVYILTRSTEGKKNGNNIHYVQWLNEGDNPAAQLKEIDYIVNLAGESINSGRWTEERKKRIIKSRLDATEAVLNIIDELNEKPEALINASAVGYYGTSETETFTEGDKKPAGDFLAQTVKQWEEKAAEAGRWDVRTAFCRFGIILEKNDGALPRMALPYKLFAGGNVGSGNQWVSWIHLDDVARGIMFAMENKDLSGPVNFTSPHPVQMKDFGRTLGSALHRPHWIPAPAFALKLALGEMSKLVLEGQRVLPAKLEAAGFSFRYPELREALEDIY